MKNPPILPPSYADVLLRGPADDAEVVEALGLAAQRRRRRRRQRRSQRVSEKRLISWVFVTVTLVTLVRIDTDFVEIHGNFWELILIS